MLSPQLFHEFFLGKRGRDGDDGRQRRRQDKPKPIDQLSEVDLAEGGRLRVLLYVNMSLGTLGTPPRGSLLTVGKNLKPLQERTQAVTTWLDGMERSQPIFKSELAEAFVHVVRAVRTAGLYNLFALLAAGAVATDAKAEVRKLKPLSQAPCRLEQHLLGDFTGGLISRAWVERPQATASCAPLWRRWSVTSRRAPWRTARGRSLPRIRSARTTSDKVDRASEAAKKAMLPHPRRSALDLTSSVPGLS